jgi:L-Ala-D/L-Glu epimerase
MTDIEALPRLLPALVEANVSLLEQPLARGREADLRGFASPVPIAADESALSLADLPGLVATYADGKIWCGEDVWGGTASRPT